MAVKYRLAALRDFSGGLNLRADQFALAQNESPDLLNVDIDPRGGVRLRGGTTVYGNQSVQAGVSASLIASKVDNTATTTFATGVCQPVANSLVLVAVLNNGNAGGDIPSSVTGNGLTYTRFATITFSSTTSTLTLWRAQGAAPTSTAVTVTYGTNRSSVVVQVVEVVGAKIGNSGADAIVQSPTSNFGDVNVASPQSLTLSAFGNVDNATIAFFANLSTGGFTVGSGFTSISQLNQGTRTLLAEYKSTNDTGADASYSGGSQRVMAIGVEIAPAVETITGAWTFNTSGGTAQVMVALGASGRVVYTTGADWSYAYVDAANASLTKTAAVMNDVCYIQDGTAVARKWSGSAKTDLGTTFNDNLSAPTNGNMPKAKLIAQHNGYMWVAYTNESGTSYPSRVRFSHPNKPEDWRTNDYIDVAIGADGDSITALVPDGDRLLVFKKHSVHAIYGFDADSFFVQPLNTTVGTTGAYSAVNTPAGVFFWNHDDGVYVTNGNSVDWVFSKIKPAITAGTLDETATVYMGWVNRRLWVSVSWASARNFLVFDPTLNKVGSWMRFDYAGTFVLSFTDSTVTKPLVVNGSKWLAKVDQSSTATDALTSTTTQHITSHYKTAWLDGGVPAIKKRWARTRTVVLADAAATLPMYIYTDYDSGSPRRSLNIEVATGSGTTLWGSGTWGTSPWSTSAETFDLERNVGAGQATAIQYKISGPTTDVKWGLDAIVATYRVKKVR